MSDREIVFDTETTGFDAEGDDRVVEIGCLELINHMPTGETFHVYVNPERDMPTGAFEVHGLSQEFLSGHDVFAKVADDFLEFVGDAPMIAHNATFDVRFISQTQKLMGLAHGCNSELAASVWTIASGCDPKPAASLGSFP